MSLMTEAEYDAMLRAVSSEVDDAIAFYHTYEEINRLAVDDTSVLAALDRDATFWTVQVAALQTSLFIVLGRLFDTSENTYSIYRAMRETAQHPEFYSKATLAARRVKNGIVPEWLDEFLAGTWAYDAEVLRELRKQLTHHAKRFKDVYQPIRHEVVAHRVGHSADTVRSLFARTNRQELKGIVHFLRDLTDAIERLYLNGTKPTLHGDVREYRYADRVRASARAVVAKIVEHAHDHRHQ